MVLGFDFDRLRSGPFEGPAIVKPPALPRGYLLFLLVRQERPWFGVLSTLSTSVSEVSVLLVHVAANSRLTFITGKRRAKP